MNWIFILDLDPASPILRIDSIPQNDLLRFSSFQKIQDLQEALAQAANAAPTPQNKVVIFAFENEQNALALNELIITRFPDVKRILVVKTMSAREIKEHQRLPIGGDAYISGGISGTQLLDILYDLCALGEQRLKAGENLAQQELQIMLGKYLSEFNGSYNKDYEKIQVHQKIQMQFNFVLGAPPEAPEDPADVVEEYEEYVAEKVAEQVIEKKEKLPAVEEVRRETLVFDIQQLADEGIDKNSKDLETAEEEHPAVAELASEGDLNMDHEEEEGQSRRAHQPGDVELVHDAAEIEFETADAQNVGKAELEVSADNLPEMDLEIESLQENDFSSAGSTEENQDLSGTENIGGEGNNGEEAFALPEAEFEMESINQGQKSPQPAKPAQLTQPAEEEELSFDSVDDEAASTGDMAMEEVSSPKRPQQDRQKKGTSAVAAENFDLPSMNDLDFLASTDSHESPEAHASSSSKEQELTDQEATVLFDAAVLGQALQDDPIPTQKDVSRKSIEDHFEQEEDFKKEFRPFKGESSSAIPENFKVQNLQSVDPEYKNFLAHHDDELLKLSTMLRNLREDRENLLKKIDVLEERNRQLEQEQLTLRAQNEDAKIESSILKRRFQQQMEELKVQLQLSEDKRSMYQAKNKAMEKDLERLNKKVHLDFQKIREREKELEGQLDLLKADTSIQINNRDLKIMELKRKIDSLEFDLENVVSKDKTVKKNQYMLEDKLDKVVKTLHSALGMLEEDAGKK